jgi:hypothetical protein
MSFYLIPWEHHPGIYLHLSFSPSSFFTCPTVYGKRRIDTIAPFQLCQAHSSSVCPSFKPVFPTRAWPGMPRVGSLLRFVLPSSLGGHQGEEEGYGGPGYLRL